MNREQKRKLERKFRAAGASKDEAVKKVDLFARAAELRDAGFQVTSEPIHFDEDEKAAIDIVKVMAHTNYDRMSEPYKAFVEQSAGQVFTVHKEQENIISFKENPTWFFWSGDLLKLVGEV